MRITPFIKIIAVLLTFSFVPVFSQTLNIDSAFSAVIKSNKADTTKLTKIEQLLTDGFNEGQNDKTISYCNQGIILAEKYNRQKSKGYFLHLKGKAYGALAEYQQALTA